MKKLVRTKFSNGMTTYMIGAAAERRIYDAATDLLNAHGKVFPRKAEALAQALLDAGVVEEVEDEVWAVEIDPKGGWQVIARDGRLTNFGGEYPPSFRSTAEDRARDLNELERFRREANQ